MKKETSPPYTCNEYREEMILLSLQRQLNDPDTPPDKKKELQKEIQRIEAQMGL